MKRILLAALGLGASLLAAPAYVPDPLDLGVNPIYDCPPYRNF